MEEKITRYMRGLILTYKMNLVLLPLDQWKNAISWPLKLKKRLGGDKKDKVAQEEDIK